MLIIAPEGWIVTVILCPPQAELKVLKDLASPSFTFAQDLLKHNMVYLDSLGCGPPPALPSLQLLPPQVIFRGGEGALQVLPPLLGMVPEARLNLAIYHLKHGECLRLAALWLQ